VSLDDVFIKEMARKAIAEGKGFEFMLYWRQQGVGWENKARKIFLQVLRERDERGSE